MRRLAIFVLLLMLLTSGCAGSAGEDGAQPETPPSAGGQSGGGDKTSGGAGAPATDGAGTPATGNAGTPATGGAGAPAEIQAAALFPAADSALRFELNEADQRRIIVEYLIREGERAIAGYDGIAYATWFVRDSGVWRMDPRGGGALLRYLPPVLEDGLTWKQTSGDAEVWFHLENGSPDCPQVGSSVPNPENCWGLTVLNRGERTQFAFAPEYGPVWARSENWGHPDLSFTKTGFVSSVPPLAPEQRSAYLAQGEESPAPEAAVTPVTDEAFEATLMAAFREGAGQNLTELVANSGPSVGYLLGPVGSWTEQPITLYRRDLSLITEVRPWTDSGRQRIEPLRIPGESETWLLREQAVQGKRFATMSLLSPRGIEVWGWAPKASYTQGNRVAVDDTGKITLEWDLEDPARHTWIREYRLNSSEPTWPMLSSLSSRFVPQEGELRYPATPKEVLHAALIAFWFDLTDELPRYFASPAVADALTANPKLLKAMYGPGSVELGTVTIQEQSSPGNGTWRMPEIQAGPVGPDGTVGFLARLGLYENAHHVYGRVTFGKDQTGRMVITDLVVEGIENIY